jgi:hypothetical protein
MAQEILATVMMNSYREDRERFTRALASVLDNDVPKQVILSTVDGDPCIAWAEDFPVEVVVNEKPGIFSQINAMIPLVKGKYVCYASSNDSMYRFKLELECDILEQSGEGVCYSAFHRIESGTRRTMSFPHYDHALHLSGKNFVSDCAMMRSDLLRTYGPFDLSEHNHAYHGLWLRIYAGEGNVFIYNDIPTWGYLVTTDSQHQRRQKDAQWHTANEAQRQAMLQRYRPNEHH